MQVYQVYVTESDNRRSVQATYSTYEAADTHLKLLHQRMYAAGDFSTITVETLDVVDHCIIDHDYPTCDIYMCRVCEDEEQDLREQELSDMEGEL